MIKTLCVYPCVRENWLGGDPAKVFMHTPTLLSRLTRFRKKIYVPDMLISTPLEVCKHAGAQKHEKPSRIAPASFPMRKAMQKYRRHFQIRHSAPRVWSWISHQHNRPRQKSKNPAFSTLNRKIWWFYAQKVTISSMLPQSMILNDVNIQIESCKHSNETLKPFKQFRPAPTKKTFRSNSGNICFARVETQESSSIYFQFVARLETQINVQAFQLFALSEMIGERTR